MVGLALFQTGDTTLRDDSADKAYQALHGKFEQVVGEVFGNET